MASLCAATCAKAVAPARARPAAARRSVKVAAKPDLHPEFHDEAKVWCNGEEVKVVSGTKEEYVVDVWSGNHPVYQGTTDSLIVEAGQLNKFDDKYGDLGDFAGDMKTINDK
uniref:50S ribosomal protein L31 n=1 Tax=Prasinoderma coloniale TaxID=156133 RepID=A0A7R9XUW0_9VIRI